MYHFRVDPLAPEAVDRFCQTFRVTEPMAQFFLRRGITRPEDLAWSLETDLRYTHNPFLFTAMEDMVERINQAVEEGEKILVFGDRDVDGMTSSALMVAWLREEKADVQWKLPMEDESYGLSSSVVEAFAAEGGTLVITVDCGISNVESITLANSLGVDVVIIDHHNPPETLPPAVAIVNPKMSDSGYPFDGLSAAAITAKVVWALRFSRTSLYNQEFCLVNARPGNESTYFDAVVVKNLCITRRLNEVGSLQSFDVVQRRILPFIQGLPLFVYQEKEQKALFKGIFGSAEVVCTDLAPVLWVKHPALAGKSLFKLLAQSRLSRYQSGPMEEIDALWQSFQLFVQDRVDPINTRYREDLSLVALSLVADMMPMVNENRILMRLGMESFAALPKEFLGLHSILVECDLARKPVQIRDLGWKIAPLINSSGRMGRPDVALNLLLSRDPSECLKLVKELSGMNNERKKSGDLAWKQLQRPVRDSMDTYGKPFALVCDPSIPRGITGILAGRFSRELDATVVVITRVEEKWVGSVRTARGMGATWLLEQCADLLLDFGGHDAAGGFSLPEKSLDTFTGRIHGIIGAWTPRDAEDPVSVVDIEIRRGELQDQHWKLGAQLLPHGQAFPAPVILVRGLRVQAAQALGKDGKHLGLTVGDGKSEWPAVFWEGLKYYPQHLAIGDTIDALVQLESNSYRSTVTPQVVIQGFVRSGD